MGYSVISMQAERLRIDIDAGDQSFVYHLKVRCYEIIERSNVLLLLIVFNIRSRINVLCCTCRSVTFSEVL